MAGDTVITIIGNITGDPELRFTPSGAAVANFTVASTRASLTGRAMSGRTARPCSCAVRCGVMRRRTSPSRCSAARGCWSPAD